MGNKIGVDANLSFDPEGNFQGHKGQNPMQGKLP